MILREKALQLVANLSDERLRASMVDAFLRHHFLPTQARGEDQPEDLYVTLLQTERRLAVIQGMVDVFGVLMPSLITRLESIPEDEQCALEHLMTLIDITHPEELKSRTESLFTLALDASVPSSVRDPIVRAAVGYARNENDARHWTSRSALDLVPGYAFRALLQIDPLAPRIESLLVELWSRQLRAQATVNTAFLTADAAKARGGDDEMTRRVIKATFANLPGLQSELVAELERYPWSKSWLHYLPLSPQGDLPENIGEQTGEAARSVLQIQHLIRATQDLDPPEDIFDKIVDGVASAALVSRVGIFYRLDGVGRFILSAGRHCLDDTSTLEFNDGDPLVGWLQRHPRLITRASLDHFADPVERSMLRRSFALLGAETFIQLNLRGRMLGWLFTGPSDALSFNRRNDPELGYLCEHIVHVLQNTIRYQNSLSQKTLSENVLQMMPTAVITTDPEGRVSWGNAPAMRLFPALALQAARADQNPSERPGPMLPVEDLGNRLAGLVRDALAGEPTHEPHLFEARERTLVVRTRQLTGGGKCLGAVALVDDVTEQIFAIAQQEHWERTRFWRQLATGISHEIRNPLVAIKTFTQLLSRRYADENFRLEFGEMVARETGRLDGIISQIESFAYPLVDGINSSTLSAMLQAAADGARVATKAADALIKFRVEDDLPSWSGDTKALTQVFQHLFINSIEAAQRGKVRAVIRVMVQSHKKGGTITGYRIAFVDNGSGIPPEVVPNVFSPFCSTKAQGLGLGLPIAQRVIVDYGGRIELDSGSDGLAVSIWLPLEVPAIGIASHSQAGQLAYEPRERPEIALPDDMDIRRRA